VPGGIRSKWSPPGTVPRLRQRYQCPYGASGTSDFAPNLAQGDIFADAAKVHAYQAKLLEMGQAHVNVAFESSQRLVAIRSPLEFPNVIAEFTSKRIAILSQQTKELVGLSTKHS